MRRLITTGVLALFSLFMAIVPLYYIIGRWLFGLPNSRTTLETVILSVLPIFFITLYINCAKSFLRQWEFFFVRDRFEVTTLSGKRAIGPQIQYQRDAIIVVDDELEYLILFNNVKHVHVIKKGVGKKKYNLDTFLELYPPKYK